MTDTKDFSKLSREDAIKQLEAADELRCEMLKVLEIVSAKREAADALQRKQADRLRRLRENDKRLEASEMMLDALKRTESRLQAAANEFREAPIDQYWIPEVRGAINAGRNAGFDVEK